MEGSEIPEEKTAMQTITQRIAEAHRDTNKGWGASVMSLQRYSIADANSETATAFLMAAVSLFPSEAGRVFPNRTLPCHAGIHAYNGLRTCVENQLRLAKSMKFLLRAPLL